MPVGLGDGVGDCHDAAVHQREGLFISPQVISGGRKLCSVFKGMVLLLRMPATEREPPLVTVMHIRWVLSGHFG